jgi:hypothetical protein
MHSVYILTVYSVDKKNNKCDNTFKQRCENTVAFIFYLGGIAVFTVKDRVCRASILAISLVFGEGGAIHD